MFRAVSKNDLKHHDDMRHHADIWQCIFIDMRVNIWYKER